MMIFSCADKYHGVVLIPEGLVESIPELYALLQVCFTTLMMSADFIFFKIISEVT
jgi:hypothetical protein